MSKLKPIGSEKLKGQEQINRMLQIAKYKEAIPNPINEDTRVEYNTKLVDGNVYYISKEKQGYIIKKGLNESTLDYIEPMKNRTYYNSYSEALKKLNLLAKELNRVHSVNEGISLFTEDKKYFLKNPNPAPTEEAPAPEMEIPAPPPTPEESPAPPSDGMDMNMPEEPADEMPAEDMPEMPDMEMEDMGPEEPEGEVSFKVIQKLTGKLAQKIRNFQEKDEEITSKDAKYVVNSILSALADNLEDDDKEDIISKLEGEEESDYGMESSGDEMPADDMGMKDEMSSEEEIPADEEMPEEPKAEMGEAEMTQELVSKIFSESKVDKILSKYFVISENERKLAKEKEKKKKLFLEHKVKVDKTKIENLAETRKQRQIAESVIESFPQMNFVGKTNKGNLVFEHNNKQLKVSPQGELL
jgi:molybdopterin converting factor small subunit